MMFRGEASTEPVIGPKHRVRDSQSHHGDPVSGDYAEFALWSSPQGKSGGLSVEPYTDLACILAQWEGIKAVILLTQ